jgi:hypothetical protein
VRQSGTLKQVDCPFFWASNGNLNTNMFNIALLTADATEIPGMGA